jgi:hypothetical protein
MLQLPPAQADVSAHVLQPPLVGVTEQFWFVYEPDSTPLVQVRVCEAQLPPQATDELW